MSLGGFCDLICHVKKALLMSENELFSTLISSKTSAAIWLSLSKNTQLCHSHVVDLFKLSQTYPWLMEFFFVIFRRYFVVYRLPFVIATATRTLSHRDFQQSANCWVYESNFSYFYCYSLARSPKWSSHRKNHTHRVAHCENPKFMALGDRREEWETLRVSQN